MVIALRLPEQIDLPAHEPATSPAPAGEQPTRPDMPRPAAARPTRRARCRCRRATFRTAAKRARAAASTGAGSPRSGPSSAEAMAVNAVLRAFSGYILFLLAFLLRSVDLGTVFHHPVSHNFALGALALGLSAGSLASMVLGSFFRSRGTAADHVHRADHRAGGDRGVRLGVRPLGGGRGRVHRHLLRQPGQARPGLDRRAARSATRSGPRRSPSPRPSTRSPTWPAAWPGWSCPSSTTARRAWRSRPAASSSRWSCSSCAAGSASGSAS